MRIPHLPVVVLAIYFTVVLAGMIIEKRRHRQNLATIRERVMVNGSRGKSSTTRLIWGALAADRNRIVVGKTTGTAAMFLSPSGREEPIIRKNKIVNVIEQLAVVRRARRFEATTLVIECMAVDPDLQELNQRDLVASHIGVITNVRPDHLDEMGGPDRDTAGVARSLCRGMPWNGYCVTTEVRHFDILAAEAARRGTELIFADADSVTDVEMAGFGYITFKENVAIALAVADLLGIPRSVALAGAYAAPPDPGVLRVDEQAFNGVHFRSVNLFAANDPESTAQNLALLRQRGDVASGVSVLINCRPDRMERNGQMGALVEELGADRIFLVGTPTKSAADFVPEHMRHLVVDLGGDDATGADLLEAITSHIPQDDPAHALVLVGNIHMAGHAVLHTLEECRYDAAAVDRELDEMAHAQQPALAHTRVMPAGAGDTQTWPAGDITAEIPRYDGGPGENTVRLHTEN